MQIWKWINVLSRELKQNILDVSQQNSFITEMKIISHEEMITIYASSLRKEYIFMIWVKENIRFSWTIQLTVDNNLDHFFLFAKTHLNWTA